MIFELDTDEAIKNASNLNGAGPATCEDLQSMNHKLPGFYMVRFKPNRVKPIYCELNQTIIENITTKIRTNTEQMNNGITSESSDLNKFCSADGSGSQPCTFCTLITLISQSHTIQ